tara:strand:+ start:4869 stop:5735 length:867 start_codon:yes stop_codon:yes gene_type:complete
MKELLNELALQAKDIKAEIELLEPQTSEAEEKAINSQQAYEQVLNSISDIDEQERKARKEVISTRQRNALEVEKLKLYEICTEYTQSFSRLDRKLQDKISELQKLESSLFAEKRTKQHKKEMIDLKLERNERDKALSDLKAREEKENDLLDTLKRERDEKMSQAFLSEVEQGNKSPETERLNKKFNEEIALQESRLEALGTVIEKTKVGFLSSCDSFNEAKDAYNYSAYKLAELEYLVALRKLMPAAVKLKAVQRMAGIPSHKDFSIRVEVDLVEELTVKLKTELEAA